MTGEELRTYIKQRGMSLTQLAGALGTSPQNLNAKFGRQTLKHDFLQTVMNILDKCCPPLPVEVEAAVVGSAVNGSGVNGSHNNATQYIGADAALAAENAMLRKQNEYLQKQLDRALSKILDS